MLVVILRSSLLEHQLGLGCGVRLLPTASRIPGGRLGHPRAHLATWLGWPNQKTLALVWAGRPLNFPHPGPCPPLPIWLQPSWL